MFYCSEQIRQSYRIKYPRSATSSEFHLEKKRTNIRALSTVIVVVAIIVIALLVGVYLNSTLNSRTTLTQTSSSTTTLTQTSSTTDTGSGIQGVVTGFVTVGPSQPTCSANQACTENMSGYSLVFTPQCSGSSSNCSASTAELSPSGHYSALLPAGNYTVTGLRPSCNWVGCSSAFPKTITVEGGMQLVVNFDIDTGIS